MLVTVGLLATCIRNSNGMGKRNIHIHLALSRSQSVRFLQVKLSNRLETNVDNCRMSITSSITSSHSRSTVSNAVLDASNAGIGFVSWDFFGAFPYWGVA